MTTPASASSQSPGTLRLAELLGPLSLVTDMGMGVPDESAMRACLVATGLARRMSLPESAVADIYYTTLLKHLGCTATAHDEAFRFGGDELVMRPLVSSTDFGRPREMLSLMSRAGAGYGPFKRAGVLARMATSNKWGIGIQNAVCEVASILASGLGMSPEVEAAIGQTFERWDGKGSRGVKGEDIALATRFAQVADRAVAFHGAGGPEAAVDAVRQSAGGWFDPAIVGAFDQHGAQLLAELDTTDPLSALLEAEPEPRKVIRPGALEGVTRAFADMVDIKSPFTVGHSSGVAALVEKAAKTVGCSPADATRLRHLAHLHDLGRVGVPSGIWDKPGSLSAAERERMQMHPYYSERILSRVDAFADLAPVAGMHHERQDGSGYHRGARHAEISLHARLLAAADAYHTMIEVRPHRPAREPSEAAKALTEMAVAGALDLDAARAIASAAGHEVKNTPRSLPAGLTERELEVLRLMAWGKSNQEIADHLVISRRTAEHHVQHIYDKIGVSTRAAASMFAVRHDLVTSPHAL
jgi:HD-GYP domain-containing protein (c-di-GMP phosphodiesterase class II)